MRILIADDDPTSRILLRAALTRLGYDVDEAADGSEAWERLQRPDAPELAILDWLMPGLTGPEVCLKLRERNDRPYIYVILLTLNNDLSALVEGLESGADDFIAKPFRTPELYARLRSGQRVLSLQRELLAERTRIENLATHDFLTGLWNRRAIFEKLGRELALSQRELRPLGVILMDIDHFKQINDRFGHAQGDQVLLETAKRLAEAIRPYDSVGRYGGEEFLLFVSNCDLGKSLSIAERLRLAVGAAPTKVSGGFIRVTGSFGVCVADPSQRASAQSVIEAADRALYRAKELGRNRVECDCEITCVSAMRRVLQ